jgi:hypothetical protein
MNIFEQLNMLLTESEDKSKAKVSDIPIHPEMETKEQGEISAAEKILKLFQKLKFGSGGGREEVKDSKPEIPDDMIDPMMKKSPKMSKEKTFEKNKLAGWDEESDEKIKKEVDIDDDGDEDDESLFMEMVQDGAIELFGRNEGEMVMMTGEFLVKKLDELKIEDEGI